MKIESPGSRRASASARVKLLRWAIPLAALIVVTGLLFSAGASTASLGAAAGEQAAWDHGSPNPGFNVLDTIPRADTVVANTTDAFAQGAVNCSNIWAINAWGNVSLYATVPVNDSSCHEGALALAPYEIPATCLSCNFSTQAPVAGATEAGGWSHRGCGAPTLQTLYDVVNGDLFEITNGGATVLLVTTFNVPTRSSESMGMTYDDVGSWNHDLVITSSTHGVIWTVNETGAVAQVAELGTYVSGPAVAPWYFGAFGGDILVAEKSLGVVESISPALALAPVTDWTKAVGVAFPARSNGCGQGGCTFGPEHDIFFLANYSSGAIEGFPASDFGGIYGAGMVAGGLNHGVASFLPNGLTTLFASGTERIGNIAFISCLGNSGGWGGWSPSAADHRGP
jgi:hypothetical protein